MDTEHCLLQSDRFLKLYILSNLHIPYTILSLPIEDNTLLILFVRVSLHTSHLGRRTQTFCCFIGAGKDSAIC